MKTEAFRRELLSALSDERRLPILDPVVIVVAHPDDETIGVGAQLPRFKNVSLIHVTDGSPRNLKDAIQAGFTNSHDYAAARRAELNAVLRIVGIPVCQAHELGFPDQEAALNLCEITRRLTALFQRIKPHVVITHPYEGGHPDHDAVAYAVHTACAVLAHPPDLVEMTSYHQSANGFVAGEFLPREDCPVNVLHLTPAEVAFKKGLFSCYRTQQATLQLFPLHEERFRSAPVYDFLSSPHTGTLFYETLDFGMTGWRFRELVRAAILAETP